MSTPPPRWRNLPTPDRVQYKDSPVVLTVFQIKFNAIWAISNVAEVGRFQQFVLDDYPLSDTFAGVQLDVQVGPAGGSVNQIDTPKGWQFYDAEDEWKLTLQVDSLTIETRRYDRFEDLISRIDRAVTALLLVYKPSILYRIGLRYVNEIRESRLGNLPLLNAINPALVGHLKDPAFLSAFSQSTTEFIDMDEHGRRLNMRYGLINGGTTIQPVAGADMPNGPFFLVDMDIYRQFDARKGTKLAAPQVDQLVNEFHSLVWQIWNWSITQEYLDGLEAL